MFEVNANGRDALTTRIYPTREDSLDVDLYTFEPATRVVDARVWRLLAAAHGEWWPAGLPQRPEPLPPPVVPEPRFRRGDANGDGTSDLSDAVAALGFPFLGGGEAIGCPDAADTNDTGEIDVSDAIRLLNFLFLGAPPPPAPGPRACGEDPTSEDPTSDGLEECEGQEC